MHTVQLGSNVTMKLILELDGDRGIDEILMTKKITLSSGSSV